MVKVRNVNSDRRWKKPKDGIHDSWIDYWNGECEQYEPTICPCCKRQMNYGGGSVGGHVRLKDDPHGMVFITPICDKCNKTYKESKAYEHFFDVDCDMLIPANYKRLEKDAGDSENIETDFAPDSDDELDDYDYNFFKLFGFSEEFLDKLKKNNNRK